MNQHQYIYKRYTSQIKHNTVILLKQQQLAQSHQRQQSKLLDQGDFKNMNDALLFKSSQQRKMQPLVLKKFEQYFKKNTNSPKNIKILNKIIKGKNNSNKDPNKTQRCLPMTSRDSAKVNTKDRKSVQQSQKPKLSPPIHTSNEKIQHLLKSHNKKNKLKIALQQAMLSKFLEISQNSVQISTHKNRKRERLNNSIDFSKALNKTSIDMYQSTIPNNQLKLISPTNNINEDPDYSNYLKIDRSILVDRKTISTQLYIDQGKRLAKQEELKNAIRTKIVSRKKALQENYQKKLRSRSPSPIKHSRKMNFLNYLNPIGREQFTLTDLIRISMLNSMIDQVKLNMGACFFSAYVQQGNNSQLIKSIIRSIGGWRVAELTSVSNLVWTQFYKKNLVQKKPKKIVRDQILQQQQNQQRRNKQRIISKDKTNISFLISRKLNRSQRISGSSTVLKRRSSSKSSARSSKGIIASGLDNNYPELSLTKHLSQQQYSYENQVQKLLPNTFQINNFILKPQSQHKKMIITPNFIIHNHLIGHRAISDKKNLLFNLRKYYHSKSMHPFNFIPESHDIVSINDDFIQKQNQMYLKNLNSEKMKKQVWIVKPGQDSNRGRGISVCKGWQEVIKQLGKRIKEKGQPNQVSQMTQSLASPNSQGSSNRDFLEKQLNGAIVTIKKQERTVILQRYIIPLLYNGRKFDIRSYMLVTWVNNVLNGYAYDECYIRTSSKPFQIDSQNKYVHLTNDAIQCLSHEYGKYEEGNKVSEIVFSKYFNQNNKNKSKSWTSIKQQMSLRCQDIIRSSSKKLVGKFGIKQSSIKQTIGYGFDSFLMKRRSDETSPDQPKQKVRSLFSCNTLVEKQTEMSFELFGLDFMIDQNSQLWLIQVNTNPALGNDCSRVLNKLIPKVIDNSLAIAVMPFMRPSRISQTLPYSNKFSHIYQQVINE